MRLGTCETNIVDDSVPDYTANRFEIDTDQPNGVSDELPIILRFGQELVEIRKRSPLA